MRKLCCLIGICLLLGSCQTVFAAETAVSAESAVVMDALSGRVLYEKNADRRSLIASTTKIMTGYLACLQQDLERSIEVPPEAVGVEGSSVYLQAGERLSLRALLYGTMLQSGNDAALALAIGCAGSEKAFVDRMNETAASLGLANTHFANPHGLDSEENYSTARDLARLGCAAMRNETFFAVVSSKTASFGNRSFVNHNKLLWRLDGAVGIKTGYTKAAGRILVSAVQRGGRLLVAVTIQAPDDWNDHSKLYEAAFSNCTEVCIPAGQCVCTAPVVLGNDAKTELIAAAECSLLLFPGERLGWEYRDVSILFPPLPIGGDAGVVHVYVNGCFLTDVPVRYGGTLRWG